MPISGPRARQLRVLALDALDARVRQFRRDEGIWPFRVPHEPLDLDAIIADALAGSEGTISAGDLKSRTVLSIDWADGHRWAAWAIALPSGIHAFCDSDGREHRLLASLKRGSALEADRFFLELLAESRGHHVGIEMGGAAPAGMRTPIDDRAFLTDIFVDLFEGTAAEEEIRTMARGGGVDSGDFRVDVEWWLDTILVAPRTPPRGRRSHRRFRDEI